MNTLELEWDTDEETRHIFCPMCGTLEDSENTAYCEHLNFIYLPHYNEFEYVADFFNTTVEELKATFDSKIKNNEDSMLNLLERIPPTGTNFMVSLSGSGMACGPTTFTAIYGFDLKNTAIG